MKNKLKPCPFCGDAINIQMFSCHGNDEWYAGCGGCGAEGPLVKLKKDSIAAWNKALRPQA